MVLSLDSSCGRHTQDISGLRKVMDVLGTIARKVGSASKTVGDTHSRLFPGYPQSTWDEVLGLNNYYRMAENDYRRFVDADRAWYTNKTGPRPNIKDFGHANQHLQNITDAANSKGITLPGSRYIGPGNPVNEQRALGVEPTTNSDRHAMNHDLDYNKAKTDQDVYNADKKAINAFFGEAGTFTGLQPTLNQIHGVIGGTGLAAKNILEERILGHTVYGVSDSNKREQEVPATPTKKQNTRTEQPVQEQPPAEPIDVDEPEATGSAPTPESTDTKMAAHGTGVAAFGIAGDNAGVVRIGQGHAPSASYVFTKKFMVDTFAFPAFRPDSTVYPAFNNNDYRGCTYPLAVLDMNDMAMYMSPAEWTLLPSGAVATHAKMSARPLGYRIPFVTNQTTVQAANNSANLIQICTSHAINHKFDGNLVFVQRSSTGSFAASRQAKTTLRNKLYETTTSAVMGVPVEWEQYYNIVTPVENGDMPCIMKAMEIVNIADVRGEEIISMEHEFNFGLLYTNTNTRPVRGKTAAFVPGAEFKFNLANPEYGTWVGNSATSSSVHKNIQLDTMPLNETFIYNQKIEKPWVQSSPNMADQPAVPLMGIGCLPYTTNLPSQSKSYQDVIVTWEISTELHVTILRDSMFTTTPTIHWKLLNPWCPATDTLAFGTNFAPDISASYFQGRNFILVNNDQQKVKPFMRKQNQQMVEIKLQATAPKIDEEEVPEITKRATDLANRILNK